MSLIKLVTLNTLKKYHARVQSLLKLKADDDHVHPDASSSISGFMSKEDKIKLDKIKTDNILLSTELTTSLPAESTSVSIEDSCILTTSIIEVYADKDGIFPYKVDIETGKITLYFSSQTTTIDIKLIVKN